MDPSSWRTNIAKDREEVRDEGDHCHQGRRPAHALMA